MPRYNDPTFHGKKGKSGRKSFPVEQAKIETIHKSWNILNNHLEATDDVEKALPIALKDMSAKTELSGAIEFKQIIGTKVIKDNGNNNIGVQNQNRQADKGV